MEMKLETKRDFAFYKKLFSSTCLISAFTIGGGYVIIPLIKQKYVDEFHWLTDDEALNLVAIAQSMPGLVAVNASVVLGYRMAGLYGSLVALFATLLPPLITLSLVSVAYDFFIQNHFVQIVLKGMQCGATALIVSVAYDFLSKILRKKILLPIVLIVCTFIASFVFKLNIMAIIFINGLIGFFFMRDKKYN